MANDLKVNSTVIGIMLGHRSEKTTKKYVKAMPSALIAIAAHMRERNPSSIFANAGISLPVVREISVGTSTLEASKNSANYSQRIKLSSILGPLLY